MCEVVFAYSVLPGARSNRLPSSPRFPLFPLMLTHQKVQSRGQLKNENFLTSKPFHICFNFSNFSLPTSYSISKRCCFTLISTIHTPLHFTPPRNISPCCPEVVGPQHRASFLTALKKAKSLPSRYPGLVRVQPYTTIGGCHIQSLLPSYPS